MRKHSFKIVLADNSVLMFKSKQTIDGTYIKKIDNISMLCFSDADLMINKDQIKEIYIDEIEIRLVGLYKVH